MRTTSTTMATQAKEHEPAQHEAAAPLAAPPLQTHSVDRLAFHAAYSTTSSSISRPNTPVVLSVNADPLAARPGTRRCPG